MNEAQQRGNPFDQRPIRWISAWAGILILSLLTAMAAREGLAALYGIQARHETGLWLRNSDAQRTAAGLQTRADDHLTAALTLDSGNPFLHEDRALWLDAQASRVKNLAPEQRAAMQRESRDHLRTALALRPVSPYTWASLAMAKSRLNEWDDEMQRAIRQAAAFGPWEAEVQLKIAAIGWIGWSYWPDNLKPVLEANVVRAAKRQRATMLRLAADLHQTDRLCMSRRLYEALKPEGCSLLVRMLQEP